MDSLLEELIAVNSDSALNFFVENLRETAGAEKHRDDETFYVASVLAHYSQTSRADTMSIPSMANLSEVFDSFILNTSLLSEAQILIETTPVPLDPNNGWRVNCVPTGDPNCKPTQIELTGTACASWHLATNKNITFDFPCDVIVPG